MTAQLSSCASWLLFTLTLLVSILDIQQATASRQGPWRRDLSSVLQGINDAEGVTSCAAAPAHGAAYGNVLLPNLKVEAEFRSRRERRSTDVTVITQCSIDRLHMLEAQCQNWGGVTSVAMYWPLLVTDGEVTNTAELLEAIRTLQMFQERMESGGNCRLDLVLLSEHIKPEMLWAYPYNALRNAGIARAHTEVLLLADVDFLVSAGLHERLSEPTANEALVQDTTTHRQVIVLPAFETDPKMTIAEGSDSADRAINSAKDHLLKMFQDREVIQFAEFYPAGHKQSNYKKWFGTKHPFPIRYKNGYEPYILISRRYMPWYDERFRGYGWDKVMHIWQLDAMGFQFIAHPNAWVIHRPHAPSAGYNATFTGEAYTKQHKGTDHLWAMEKIAKNMMSEIKRNIYPARGVTALSACRKIPEYPDRMDKWW